MSNSSAAAVSERGPKLTLTDRIDMIKNNRFFPIIFPLAMLVFLLLLFVVLTGGEFMKRSVILGIFNQSFITGTMATAVAFIYSTGNVDFSVGNAMGLACVLGALAYQATGSMAVMVLVTLAGGVLLMMFNCTLCVTFKVKPAMVAIVAMSIYSAICVVLVGAAPIGVDYETSKSLEGVFRYGSFFLYFGMCLLLYHGTAIGRKLRFIGGNEKCAIQTGINAVKTQYISFLFAGAGVGLAGVYQTIRTANVASTVGTGMGTDVMLATVLGGMSIFGGTKSNCFAGLIGAITVTILNKGLLMVGVSSTMIQGIRGIVFLLLVYLNSERQKTLPSRQQF